MRISLDQRSLASLTDSTNIPALLRRGAWAVAAGRVAIGLTALAWPSVPARPWVGAAADNVATQVFARSLGARDLALGLGALAALQRPGAEPASAGAWVAAGALSDSLDVAASLASWRELPRIGRWLVVLSAGGAALAGAAGALAVRLEKNDPAAPGWLSTRTLDLVGRRRLLLQNHGPGHQRADR